MASLMEQCAAILALPLLAFLVVALVRVPFALSLPTRPISRNSRLQLSAKLVRVSVVSAQFAR